MLPAVSVRSWLVSPDNCTPAGFVLRATPVPRRPRPTRKPKPAPAQMRVLQFIKEYKAAHDGNPPSREQIAHGLGCSLQNVDSLLHKLERKRLISFDERGQIMVAGGRWMPTEPPELPEG